MPDRPVVANNTPLVALWTLRRLDLFGELYGEILIPEAVRSEFLAVDSIARSHGLETSPWIRTAAVSEERRVLAYLGLDQGEAEVLALAEEHDARLVILDEKKGRRYARRMGFALTGTVGLLLAAKEEGLVHVIKPLLGNLQEAGMYLGELLIKQAVHLAGE